MCFSFKHLSLGVPVCSKIDIFLEKVGLGEGGLEGGHFRSKNFIADFLYSKWYILVIYFGKISKKGELGGGGSSPIQKIIAIFFVN